MKPYIITVEFRLRPGCREAFIALIRENAARSLADEPAFAAHCQTPHFFEFDRASRNLCESKIVQRYTLIPGAEAETAS